MISRPMSSRIHDRERPREMVLIHLEHCDCAACMPHAPGDRRSMSLSIAARWGLAGCLTGNAIAFALDPHGAWRAIAAAASHLLGR
ncbi:hypothetical protein [Sphingomonas bacterium]|uniref:hypothetical protein n=1 Tax=Sphingomonas bacterium TaxID=1895847 RepID=UPI001575D049|nr:hypothetical protein [Sphingomonas bacterium]